MPQITATVDIQFHPVGDGFTYMDADDPAVQTAKLDKVLDACGKLGSIFERLIPDEERDWWTAGSKLPLKLTLANGQVPVKEIVEQVNLKLASATVAAGDLKAMRPELPAGIVMANDGSVFPPLVETAKMDLNFGVESPSTGNRVYYSMPDGSVKCCAFLTLTANDQPVMLSDAAVADGRLDVVLAVHFAI